MKLLNAQLHNMIDEDLKFIQRFISFLPTPQPIMFEAIQREIIVHVVCSARHAFTLNPFLREK